jgi:thiol-disulfide isomerase/thioredoxin
MNQNVGMVLFFLAIVAITGGIIVTDVIKNNRLGQIISPSSGPKSNWAWGDNWSDKDHDQGSAVDPISPVAPSAQVTASTYQNALQLSGQRGMPVLVYFEADWCTWCKKMKRDILPQVNMKHYILVYVDVDRNRAVANKFGIRSLPAYVITNARENSLKVGDKYREVDDFRSWLNNPHLYQQPRSNVPSPPQVQPPWRRSN